LSPVSARSTEFRRRHACARLSRSKGNAPRCKLLMSQANPIRLFVTHLWEDSDDYLRVFEYLESARNFFYRNTARPELRPEGDKEAHKETLRKQIAPVEVVVALSSLYGTSQDLLTFQLLYAQASQKPVV